MARVVHFELKLKEATIYGFPNFCSRFTPFDARVIKSLCLGSITRRSRNSISSVPILKLRKPKSRRYHMTYGIERLNAYTYAVLHALILKSNGTGTSDKPSQT